MMAAISQKGSHKYFDAVVIGAGVAGLSYVLSLLQLRPNANIALLSKTTLTQSNSAKAQGGIAAVASTDDTFENHIADTLKAGSGLCQLEAVEAIIKAGPAAVDFLQSHQVNFDKDTSGFHLHQEGGHSERRIYHQGDASGKAIIDALISSVKREKQITILEDHIAVNLIASPEKHQPGAQPEVQGLYVLDVNNNKIDTIQTNVVVLACGGAGKVYRYTTNSGVATGDGVAMAHRVGARIRNMEFYQFHPTLLYHRDENHFLLSEALRGEGAYLRNPNSGRRFMEDHAPSKMEMATRDVVARAVFTEIEKHHCDYVHLDVRHLDENFLREHFPTIHKKLATLGLDLHKDMIPVVPAAHYMCGGVLADVSGRTDVKRLFAIGETAFTGLHGANRLASNSLLEGVVMGRNAANASNILLEHKSQATLPLWNSKSVVDLRRASQINANWRSLRGEMTSYAGMVRTAAGLKDLLALIKQRRYIVDNYYWQHMVTRDLIELRNICLVAELISHSALKRARSIGGHFREDDNQPHETYERDDRQYENI